jgi:ribosome biogenesis SPOUT family RNA methylase Rps3
MRRIIIKETKQQHDVNCVDGVELSADQIHTLRQHVTDDGCFYDQINGAYWFTQDVINLVAQQIPHNSEHNTTLQSLVR